MSDLFGDTEMVAAEEYQEPFSNPLSINENRILSIRELKHAAIGSKRQKELIKQRNLIPQLVNILNDNQENQDVLMETTILLGSLAEGSQDVLNCLIEAGVVRVMLKALHNSYRPFVEACLRCLRSIFVNANSVPVKDIYNDRIIISILLKIANSSACNQDCVATILSRSCQNIAHQNMLLEADAVEIMAPCLFSGLSNVQQCGLAFYAALSHKNYDAALTVANYSHLGRHLIDQFVALMSRGNDFAMQLAAAKCLTNIYRSGAIESGHNIISLKVMPTLIRCCKYDPILNSAVLRVQACETLAYLIEENIELQRLASWNNQCLKILSTCINDADADEPKMVVDLQSGALCVVAALSSNDEEIRKKVIGEIHNLLDHVFRGLNSVDRSIKMVRACTKCLHSLSRSVEQLRTTFNDRQLWRRLVALVQQDDVELASTASAVLNNLTLEFSPNKKELIEAGTVDIFCELARREEPSLRLNGIWGLMNLAFRADEKIKQSIIDSLSPEQLLRLLTETSPDSPVVLRLLGLLRNLLSQKTYIDRVMASYGASVMQAIIFVLEGDYVVESKEQALCVLSNIAEGDSAKDFIVSNEDVLRKITNYMMHTNSRLQVASTSCVCNLVWKDSPGFIERQSKLRELGLVVRLEQLARQQKNNPTLHDKVKTALQHLS